MRWVAVFSGQGGQRAAHVPRLLAMSGVLRDAWERALASAGATPHDLDDATLARNRVAQPTLCAFELHAHAAIAPHVPPPALVAGYSVGEIAACAVASGLDATHAVDVARARAACMDDAVAVPSGLAAVLGLDEAEVAAACERAGAAIAIRNGPRHLVVGGPDDAIALVCAQALDRGATRAFALPVATPAHTRWLASAVAPFADVLAPHAREPRIAMISAIDASRLRTSRDVVSALSRQLATRLDWQACMEAIGEARADAVLEIGPGNALARMIADALPGVRARSLDDFREPAAAAAWLRSAAT